MPVIPPVSKNNSKNIISAYSVFEKNDIPVDNAAYETNADSSKILYYDKKNFREFLIQIYNSGNNPLAYTILGCLNESDIPPAIDGRWHEFENGSGQILSQKNMSYHITNRWAWIAIQLHIFADGNTTSDVVVRGDNI